MIAEFLYGLLMSGKIGGASIIALDPPEAQFSAVSLLQEFDSISPLPLASLGNKSDFMFAFPLASAWDLSV